MLFHCRPIIYLSLTRCSIDLFLFVYVMTSPEYGNVTSYLPQPAPAGEGTLYTLTVAVAASVINTCCSFIDETGVPEPGLGTR